MDASFNIFEDASGAWRFRLRAANGEPLSTSEAYTRREDAERGARDLVAAVLAIVARQSIDLSA